MSFSRLTFPDRTPIDPVRVWGWATIRWAAMEIQYPPEPAMSDIETTNGLTFRQSMTSRQIVSEATADPPGLSTRKTTAAIERVLAGRPDPAGDGFGAHGGRRAPAAVDRAAPVDQGDAPAAVQSRRDRGNPVVFGEPDSARRASVRFEQRGDLVLVEQVVDEPRFDGPVALEEGLVDEPADLGLGLAPGRGDGPDISLELVADDRFQHLAVRRGEPALGEHIVGGLVFLDVLDLGFDAELVEPFLQEGNDSPRARDAEPAERVEDDPVAGRGQVILLVELGRLLDVGVDGLPRFPEVEDRVADLGALRPIPSEHAEAEENALDPSVAPRLLQVQPDVVDAQRAAGPQDRGPHVRGGIFLDRSRERDLEIRGRGDRRRAPEFEEDEGHGGGQEEEREHEDEEKHGAAFSHRRLLGGDRRGAAERPGHSDYIKKPAPQGAGNDV